MKTLCRFMVAISIFAAFTSFVCGQPQTSTSKVKITGEASKVDSEGKQTVTLHLDIAKGWHLYANPIDNADFKDAQTVVKVKAGSPLKSARIEYPPGMLVKDKVLGDYKVFEGMVDIKAHLVRNTGDNSPLDVSVDVQACDSKGCLLPGTVKLTVK
jgi:Disulphide bond corrector protein DsbC